MPVLKAKYNGEWADVVEISSHSHTIDEIVDFPSSLPNQNALIVNGIEYDGSTSVDITEQINLLIDARISAITSAEEVAF